jgi:high-affinity nickel permease
MVVIFPWMLPVSASSVSTTGSLLIAIAFDWAFVEIIPVNRKIIVK